MAQHAFASASQQIMPPETGRVVTPRLVIRPYAQEDVKAVAEVLLEKRRDELTPENILQAQRDAHEMIMNLGREPDRVVLGLFLRNDETLVGEVGANSRRAKRAHEWSLYYATRPAYQEQGYMSEGFLAVMPQFPERLGAKFLVATTSIENRASQAILKKAGLRAVHSPGMHLTFEIKF